MNIGKAKGADDISARKAAIFLSLKRLERFSEER
jgi:hypothetical protein